MSKTNAGIQIVLRDRVPTSGVGRNIKYSAILRGIPVNVTSADGRTAGATEAVRPGSQRGGAVESASQDGVDGLGGTAKQRHRRDIGHRAAHRGPLAPALS